MKKSFTVLAGIMLLLLLGACNAHAQYATKNVVELGGTISYSSTTAVSNGDAATNSTSIFQFMPYVDYFITDGFSVGLLPGINIIKLAGATSSTTYLAIFAAPGYTFTTGGNLFPFVEGLVGYTGISSNGNSQGGLSYGGKAGLKIVAGRSGLAAIGISYMLIDLRQYILNKQYL
jgi:hypothetical protein